MSWTCVGGKSATRAAPVQAPFGFQVVCFVLNHHPGLAFPSAAIGGVLRRQNHVLLLLEAASDFTDEWIRSLTLKNKALQEDTAS